MDTLSSEWQTSACRSSSEGFSWDVGRSQVWTGNSELDAADNAQHCLEMFMRALHGDQSAQEWFKYHFSTTLLEWLNHHPCREIVCASNNEAYLVDKTFQCIWHNPTDHAHFEFQTLPAVMRYLCASLNGVMLDALRAIKGARAYIPSGSTQEPAMENHTEALQIWEKIVGLLSNERERQLAYLLLNCGLKPKEIVGTFPQEFNDMCEIARVRVTIMQLLSNI
jgi:hypothetical protein